MTPPHRRASYPLDGPGWHVREALGETWRWYVDADRELGVPATVPGSVVTDLHRAGDLPDPTRARNSRAAEWTGARSWVYRRCVDVPAREPGAAVSLEFDGIDPSGTVFWDGAPIGRAPGLFHPVRLTIPAGADDPGVHRLAVVVDPVPASQPQVGRTELVRTHRPRMNEGWDFCPRLPHQGIWRPARLVVAPTSVTDVTVRTEASGIVHLSARISGGYRITVADADGAVVAEQDGTSAGRVTTALTVADPQLWWPRGVGPPTRYRVRLEADGATAWQGEIGFRSVELVANPEAPHDALPYTAVVNGRVVPLVGWNWVPVDAQYGAVDAERVRHLVELAARSGARVLRVWGGGLLETEEFYTACDAAGLLVWQEFAQSSSGFSSAPATDDEFVATMRAEAAVVIPPRTHHPSLLLWCGGNELAADGPLDETRSPVLAALRDCVHSLDPGRPWLPTSPSGVPGRDDVHGPWEHQGLTAHYQHYNDRTALAHTEFGVEGMANRRLLRRTVPEDARWPADRSNPVYRHLGEWWNNEPLVQASFRHQLTDLESLRRASQLLQATGLGYAVEANRRRFPRCSMVLPWQLGESYPNAWCTSSVDHRGEPKPAYFAVARAFARRRVTVRVPTAVWAGEPELWAESWVWDEAGIAPGSRIDARLRSVTGAELASAAWRLDTAVREPRAVGRLRVPASTVPADAAVVWDVTWTAADGAQLDRDVVLACTGADWAPLLDLAAAHVDVVSAPGAVHVTHRDGPMVLGLQLVDAGPVDAPCRLVAGGDPRPLLPGESRTFAVHRSAPAAVEGWNIDAADINAADIDLREGKETAR